MLTGSSQLWAGRRCPWLMNYQRRRRLSLEHPPPEHHPPGLALHRPSPDPRRSLRATISATDSVTPLTRLAAPRPCIFEDPQFIQDLSQFAWPVNSTDGTGLGVSPISCAAHYISQLVKGLLTRFRRVAATRARCPGSGLWCATGFLMALLNAYCLFTQADALNKRRRHALGYPPRPTSARYARGAWRRGLGPGGITRQIAGRNRKPGDGGRAAPRGHR